MDAVLVASEVVKPNPEIVRLLRPLIAVLRRIVDAIGESYVMKLTRVPTAALTVTIALSDAP